MTKILLFSGNSNRPLADKICQHMNVKAGQAKVEQFSDGEINILINENVRGKEVFLLQSTSYPTNDHIMELLILANAAYHASAKRITAIMPYYGYARQDRRIRAERVPISAALVANMITAGHIDRVLTLDLHSEQIQGFFGVPLDNIYASSVLIEDIQVNVIEDSVPTTVISPDVGGIQRARAIAKQINAELAIIDKRREQANTSQVMNVIGNVSGKNCIIIDDMIDTAGTLTQAAQALQEHGALKVYAYATHAVLSGEACSKITQSCLEEVVITDTIILNAAAQKTPKIRSISVSKLLAECIRRLSNEESLSALFKK